MGLQPRTAGVAGTQGIFLGLTYLFVISRLYVRKSLVKRVSWDDYVLIIAQLFFTVYVSLGFVAIAHDFSVSVDYEKLLKSLDKIATGLKYWWLSQIFYALTCIFLRISVGILLTRVASTKAQVRVIYLVLVVMILAGLGLVFTVIFQCSPIQYYWTQWTFATGHCSPSDVVSNAAYVHAAVSFVADCVLGLMPIWLLWNVQVSKERKLGISVLLGMGLLCGAVAIIRVPYIYRLENSKHFITDWPAIAITSVAEPGVGIVAASLAAFRPIFHTLRFQSLYSRLLSSKLSWSKSKRSSATQPSADSSAMAREGKFVPVINKTTSFSVKKDRGTQEKYDDVDLS